MYELALFAGIYGPLGSTLHGWQTKCAVELNAYRATVLAQRQNDRILPPFPIWSDVRTFNGKSWKGIIDVISGGFPCQDISTNGKKKGIKDGEKSALWFDMARIILEVEPEFVFVENSPNIRHKGFEFVLDDLASMGYDAKWGVLGASHAGAPHRRKRMWILATNSNKVRCKKRCGNKRIKGAKESNGSYIERCFGNYWREVKPPLPRMDDRCPSRMERLEASGDSQVPAVAKLAWQYLT